MFDGVMVCILTKIILVGEYPYVCPSKFLNNYESINIHHQVNATAQRATSAVFSSNCPTAFHLDPKASVESEESRAFKVHRDYKVGTYRLF